MFYQSAALLSIFFFSFVSGDVLRTVFCSAACNDYLQVPESQMPACAEEHLKMNMCGTVITCDWREAEKDKNRPIANSTDNFKCCYRTEIKEKGDCDAQLAEAQKAQERKRPTVEVHIRPSGSLCTTTSFLPWILTAVLAVIVALETGYLLWLRMNLPITQKVCSADTLPQCQRPLYTARPLIDQRLLA